MPVIFKKRDRDFIGYNPRSPKPRWRDVSRKGETFDISGTPVELFRLKVFCEAIDRESQIVKRWIKVGHLPPPLYTVAGHRCKHWYSMEQIINCNRLMMTRWRGRKYLRGDEFESFVREVKQVFYARTVIVAEDGTIGTER